jgi:hypothetical protein
MSKPLEDIARRKHALIDKAARERGELAAAYAAILSRLDVGSTLLRIGRALKTHPIIAAGASSFLVSGYAGKLMRSAGALLKLWKLALPIWAWWRKRRKSN